MMLNRMQEAMDNILQQEQAGFHKGRSCCEQIFTLRQIVEKVQAWLTDLCYADDVALIDDSVDGLQAMMDSVACWAKKVGLSINVAKTKWMAVGNSSNGNGQLMMNGEQANQ